MQAAMSHLNPSQLSFQMLVIVVCAKNANSSKEKVIPASKTVEQVTEIHEIEQSEKNPEDLIDTGKKTEAKDVIEKLVSVPVNQVPDIQDIEQSGKTHQDSADTDKKQENPKTNDTIEELASMTVQSDNVQPNVEIEKDSQKSEVSFFFFFFFFSGICCLLFCTKLDQGRQRKFVLFKLKAEDLIAVCVSGAEKNMEQEQVVASLATPFLKDDDDKLFQCFDILANCFEVSPFSQTIKKTLTHSIYLCLESMNRNSELFDRFQEWMKASQPSSLKQDLVMLCLATYLHSVFCEEKSKSVTITQINTCYYVFRLIQEKLQELTPSQKKDVSDVMTHIAANANTNKLNAAPLFKVYAISIMEKIE